MSVLEETLRPDAPEVIVRLMLTLDRAADDHLGDCARRGFKPRTLATYRRTYDQFAARLPNDIDVSKITTDDVRRFLNTNRRLAAGTIAGYEAHLASLFRHLYLNGKIARDPMDRLVRTKRQRPEDLDVTTISSDEVRLLFAATRSWTERLALGVLCFLGPRRHAVALLRLSDYDELHRRIRFREKGGKTIWKPVPAELDAVIRAAMVAGVYTDSLTLLADNDHSGDPYLIPPQAKLRKPVRDDRVIWRIVRDVAARAGVHTHVHALRAAFAVAYLERERDLIGLQELLGHQSTETTRIYLRKMDRGKAMEPVRSFSWGVSLLDNDEPSGNPQIAGNMLESSPVMGAGGFEPPYASSPHQQRDGSQHLADALLEHVTETAAEVVDPEPVGP